MVIVRNNYDDSTYSFDGDVQHTNFELRATFPHICKESSLSDNLKALDKCQAFSVWTDMQVEHAPMSKAEYQLPKINGKPFNEDDPQLQQKYAKHLLEHLSPHKRNVLRSIMVACELEPTHPYYWSAMANKPFDYGNSKAFRSMVHRKMQLEPQDVKKLTEHVSSIADDITRLSGNVVFDPVNEAFVQVSNVHGLHKSLEDTMHTKVPDNILHFGHKLSNDDKFLESDVVADLVGGNNDFNKFLEAAKFLSGRETVPLERARYAFVRFEDDPEAAALYAVGLQDSTANREALKAAAQANGGLNKSEEAQKGLSVPHSVRPVDEDGQSAAEEVSNAYKTGGVHKIELVGKHSKGTLIARDPRTMHVWLLKPGSGSVSPAAGVADETASQSDREVAFSHVAKAWGLAEHVIRAELLQVDQERWAALNMLPFDFQNADKWKKADAAFLFRTLERYRDTGMLHKLAVLDFVLGNPDRHAQNIMISRRGEMSLIDHGSAFAGKGFAPGTDDKSFVPFYLRYQTKGFNNMTPEDRMRHMPRISRVMEIRLRDWIAKLDEGQMDDILGQYTINPQPSNQRLSMIKQMVQNKQIPIDEQLNMLWLNT
jgi:hypothetical protein